MLKKRIIPCLDVKNGRTVKGINFINLQDAGDAVSLAKAYAEQGADELVFLDITASVEKRKTLIPLVERVAQEINIPFTVGGGISTVDDVAALLQAGADKVSINTAAVKHPEIITQLASRFGRQCVVVAIDASQFKGQWKVFIHGGRTPTDYEAVSWAVEAEKRGAGEILLTSMLHDGTKNGFAIELTRMVARSVKIPVIASGGAGKPEHFTAVFREGEADAALAASVFHFAQITIPRLKQYLHAQNIPVRCNSTMPKETV
ncbi:MAG: imidazole glycerol phosphate synthase subunit HisF [Chitinophagales bacterium]|nr:MAG: imidazole glycerol phosphate synthase subunit HisF [Chitinophagales bacterium]